MESTSAGSKSDQVASSMNQMCRSGYMQKVYLVSKQREQKESYIRKCLIKIVQNSPCLYKSNTNKVRYRHDHVTQTSHNYRDTIVSTEKLPREWTDLLPPGEDWTLTPQPSKIPFSEKFPQVYNVSTLPPPCQSNCMQAFRPGNRQCRQCTIKLPPNLETMDRYIMMGSSQSCLPRPEGGILGHVCLSIFFDELIDLWRG
jgi:hypothetical protein